MPVMEPIHNVLISLCTKDGGSLIRLISQVDTCFPTFVEIVMSATVALASFDVPANGLMVIQHPTNAFFTNQFHIVDISLITTALWKRSGDVRYVP